MKPPLFALAFLLAVVGAISYAAGLTYGARKWRPKALYADSQKDQADDAWRYLGVCQDHLAQARAASPVKLGKVVWGQ